MSAPLYTSDILRLATSIPHLGRLDHADAHVELRSPICGSRVAVDVRLDAAGHVEAFTQTINACALGQASAALLGAHVVGCDLDTLDRATAALTRYLDGSAESPGDWPGLALFDAARAYPARHASIRLPFEAVVAAVRAAHHAKVQHA